jgi:hypothetical protein
LQSKKYNPFIILGKKSNDDQNYDPLVENDKNNADDENQNTQNSANVNNDVDWVTDDDDNEDVINEEIKDKGNNRRSEVWKYFDIVECTSTKTGKKVEFVKCNIDCDDGSKCGKMLKYHNSTKYLLNHLQSKHKIIEKVKNSNNPIKKDPKELLMMFIVTAALPFRCAENKYFVEFCKALNSNFKLPDRKEISRMTKLHHKVGKDKLKRELEDVKHIALTSDCWTSKQNYPYIDLTAHYLNSNFQIRNLNLAVRHILGGHNSENLAKYMRNIIKEYKIDSKISFIVTDNASSVVNAVEKLGFKSLRCFGHILNLIIKSTFKSIKESLKNEDSQVMPELINYDFSLCTDENIDIQLALESIDSSVKSLLSDNINVFENFDTGCK